MRALLSVSIGVVTCAAPAFADDALTARATPEKPFSRHLIYGELLGKGGLYGVGYEYTMTPRFSVGAAASFAVLRDQQVTTVAPYLHATILQGKRNALFTEVGAILAHTHLPSPVDRLGWHERHRLRRLSVARLGVGHAPRRSSRQWRRRGRRGRPRPDGGLHDRIRP